MGSHKSRDDEIYEQGVHDGQQADFLDQFSHSLSKGYTLNPRENEIYNKGYDYGVSHRPAPANDRSASSESNRGDRDGARHEVASSASDTGCAQVIGVLIGIAILVVVVVWLIANIVLPVALLNSAVICTVVALTSRQRKTAFASLALVCACYMLVDISNGWLSANFVNNVVHTASWLTAFVYMNTAAVGVSAWLLVRPLFAIASTEAAVENHKALLLSGGAVMVICVVAITPPLVYHLAPNPFLVRTPPNSQQSAQTSRVAGGGALLEPGATSPSDKSQPTNAMNESTGPAMPKGSSTLGTAATTSAPRTAIAERPSLEAVLPSETATNRSTQAPESAVSATESAATPSETAASREAITTSLDQERVATYNEVGTVTQINQFWGFAAASLSNGASLHLGDTVFITDRTGHQLQFVVKKLSGSDVSLTPVASRDDLIRIQPGMVVSVLADH